MDLDLNKKESNIIFKPKPYEEILVDTNMDTDDILKQNNINMLHNTGSILNRSSMMTYGKM
jgi:hypothetical protein